MVKVQDCGRRGAWGICGGVEGVVLVLVLLVTISVNEEVPFGISICRVSYYVHLNSPGGVGMLSCHVSAYVFTGTYYL